MAPIDLPVAIVRQVRSDNDTDSAILQSLSDAGNYITSHSWTYVLIALLAAIAIAVPIISCLCCWCCCRKKQNKNDRTEGDYPMKDRSIGTTKQQEHEQETKFDKGADECEELEDQDDSTRGVRYFLRKHPDYTTHGATPQSMELGSRMQKHWYKIGSTKDDEKERMLTIAPVSQNCPLELDKYQKSLNKVLETVKIHPYLHSIDVVDYLVDHELLVMVQPLMKAGSLKDMIYKSSPLSNWSEKYAHRSKPLPSEKIARYGRHILEAMKFLYSKGFPMLGHVQSGNIFVVDDVCHLGGYENTLLGYRTRLFRLCKDELDHFDVILFGHVVFEMAAGYELTHLRPGQAEYKTVDKRVRPVLEYIFEEGFPHDVNDISQHDFFGASLTEISDFHPEKVEVTDNMRKVLDKVRKAKPRSQKAPKSEFSRSFSQFISGIPSKLKRTSQTGKTKKEEQPLLSGSSQ